jgi:hypothetical protein
MLELWAYYTAKAKAEATNPDLSRHHGLVGWIRLDIGIATGL